MRHPVIVRLEVALAATVTGEVVVAPFVGVETVTVIASAERLHAHSTIKKLNSAYVVLMGERLSLDDGASGSVPGLMSNAGAWRSASAKWASQTRAAWRVPKSAVQSISQRTECGPANELLDLLTNDLKVQAARVGVDATNRLENVPLCINSGPRLTGGCRGERVENPIPPR